MKEDNGLRKKHLLKSRKQISALFSKGKTIKKQSVLLKFNFTESKDKIDYKVGFSVSKKKFKRAVDRNRIKRQMREGFRNNKSLLINSLNKNNIEVTMMFIYTDKQLQISEAIHEQIQQILERIGQQVNRNNIKN